MIILFQIRNGYFPYFIFQMYFRITLTKQKHPVRMLMLYCFEPTD